MDLRSIGRGNIEAAMKESDALGFEAFRKKYGFQAARNLRMHDKSPRRKKSDGYEARPLVAAAYADKYPRKAPLGPKDFMNNDAHDFLEKQFGFERRPISK